MKCVVLNNLLNELLPLINLIRKAGRTRLLYDCIAFLFLKYIGKSHSFVKAEKVTDCGMEPEFVI